MLINSEHVEGITSRSCDFRGRMATKITKRHKKGCNGECLHSCCAFCVLRGYYSNRNAKRSASFRMKRRRRGLSASEARSEALLQVATALWESAESRWL